MVSFFLSVSDPIEQTIIRPNHVRNGNNGPDRSGVQISLAMSRRLFQAKSVIFPSHLSVDFLSCKMLNGTKGFFYDFPIGEGWGICSCAYSRSTRGGSCPAKRSAGGWGRPARRYGSRSGPCGAEGSGLKVPGEPGTGFSGDPM